MFEPQKKHKAQHGGYKKKPSLKEVNALLGLYEGIANVKLQHPKPKAYKPNDVGVQLKFKFL